VVAGGNVKKLYASQRKYAQASSTVTMPVSEDEESATKDCFVSAGGDFVR